jgi:hypothetical protein
MGEREYEIQLSLDVRGRFNFVTTKESVVGFVVQVEVLVKDQWHPAVRYDTAHGFAHCDWYRRDGSCEKIDLQMSFDDALT